MRLALPSARLPTPHSLRPRSPSITSGVTPGYQPGGESWQQVMRSGMDLCWVSRMVGREPNYQRLQTFLQAQPAPWRQTRRCVQAMPACSMTLVLPTATIDVVASARSVNIATVANSAAVAAVTSRSLGILSSLTLLSREITPWSTCLILGQPLKARGKDNCIVPEADLDGAGERWVGLRHCWGTNLSEVY